MRIQYLVFPEQHRCEVREKELDEDLAPGEVLIRNKASLVSAGTELAMFTRAHRGFDEPDFPYAKYPFHPGYAAVGEVIRSTCPIPSGTRVFHGGHHQTFSRAKAEHVLPLPDGLSDEHGCFYALANISMTSPRMAPAKVGENVLVLGMGIVGNLCAQLYALSGAGLVGGVDLSEPRLKKAYECGVAKLHNPRNRPTVEWLREAMGPRGAEIVVEAIGLSQTIAEALKVVADQGLVVLLGSPRGKMEIDPYFDIHRKGIAVIGAHGRNVDKATRERDKGLLLDWLDSERLKIAPLITQRMPFSEGARAFEGLRDKPDEFLGVILTYASY